MRHTALLLIMLLVGCSTPLTYDAMSQAYDEAISPEEKEVARERLVTFEANAEKARSYFELKRTCQQGKDTMWFCKNTQSINADKIKSLDGLVKSWKREYQSCGCANSRDIQNSLRGIGY